MKSFIIAPLLFLTATSFNIHAAKGILSAGLALQAHGPGNHLPKLNVVEEVGSLPFNDNIITVTVKGFKESSGQSELTGDIDIEEKIGSVRSIDLASQDINSNGQCILIFRLTYN
jgi:hypothetical protein